MLNTGLGRPRQSNLRRAISTVYYAMFHCLAKCCADTIVGGRGATRSAKAWTQAYRALDHGKAKNRCANQKTLKAFPKPIADFAYQFVALQRKRHKADYAPAERYTTTKTEVIRDLDNARGLIQGFEGVDRKHRRAFAVYLLLPIRRD